MLGLLLGAILPHGALVAQRATLSPKLEPVLDRLEELYKEQGAWSAEMDQVQKELLGN